MNRNWCVVALVLGTAGFIYLICLQSYFFTSEEYFASVALKNYVISKDVVESLSSGHDNPDDPVLLKYLQNRWIDGPSAQKYNLVNPKYTHFSQRGQDIYVDKLLDHKSGGFFIEVGAYDGEHMSNSLYFERERNWTGLLVEPDPKLYKELLQKNRKSYTVNACLSTDGRSSIRQFGVANGIGSLEAPKEQVKRLFHVQCFTLASLLSAMGVKHVDYFSLDVEFSELDILHTVPFDKVYFDVFTVEYPVYQPNWRNGYDWPASVKKLNEIRKFFANLGTYREVAIIPFNGGAPFEKGSKKLTQDYIDNHGLDVVFKHI